MDATTKKPRKDASKKPKDSRPAQGRYHPGLIEATEFGKRYGKNLTPLCFDTPGHTWHVAKDKNWGRWSCCDGAANSFPCTPRVPVPRAVRRLVATVFKTVIQSSISSSIPESDGSTRTCAHK